MVKHQITTALLPLNYIELTLRDLAPQPFVASHFLAYTTDINVFPIFRHNLDLDLNYNEKEYSDTIDLLITQRA